MRTRIHIFALPLCLMVLFLCACEKQGEAPPDGLSSAYADLLTYRNASRDLDSTMYASGVDSILSRHGFDRTTFAHALSRLGSDADEVNDFFDAVTGRLSPRTQSEEQ